MADFLLNYFLGLAILAALVVVISKDPIVSIVFLVLLFVFSAGFLLCLGAEFLALLFILVYVGAVAVLFLFVIMMLNLKLVVKSKFNYLVDTLVLFFLLLAVILSDFFVDFDLISGFNFNFFFSNIFFIEWVRFIDLSLNMALIGEVIYVSYFFLFILAGFILLLAMIGPIVLTLKKRLATSKAIQQVFEQNLRYWGNTLRLDNTASLKKSNV